MKLELLSDDSNRFIQALIDYDINSKDKYGSNLLHYYIMNYKSIVHPAGVIIPEFVKKGLDINEKRKDGRPGRTCARLPSACPEWKPGKEMNWGR